MSEAYTGGGNTAVLGAADWLCLAAAPTFAIMALLTGALGGGLPDMLCSAAQDASPLSGMGTTIDAGISAGGRHGQPAEVMRPALVVAGALRGVRKTAMGHAQRGAAVPVDQVDLDQARSRRHLLIPFPPEAVGETVDRHDHAERSP